jgi:hypothetical protein
MMYGYSDIAGTVYAVGVEGGVMLFTVLDPGSI